MTASRSCAAAVRVTSAATQPGSSPGMPPALAEAGEWQ
jgi:hypothetical protein